MRFMKPSDCTKYTNLSPQYIREVMKREIHDIGFVTNFSGKRFSYYIHPVKFFNWIGMDVPSEWR